MGSTVTSQGEMMVKETPRFWDDFDLMVMDDQVDLFRDYLHVMEEFLETEAKRYRERARRLCRERYEKLRQHGCQFDPIEPPPSEEAWIRNQEQMVEAVFASILRKSFFIGLYAFLESRLLEECRYRERWGRTKLPLADVIGRGIDTAKECLKGQVDFGGREWQEIKRLQRLRNFVVHCGNNFENVKSERDEELLKNDVAQEQFLSLGYNGITFHQGFCEKALDAIEAFLDVL
jgi:hypothetical protein